jgi:O-antigen/teichoic acid export membrane protein
MTAAAHAPARRSPLTLMGGKVTRDTAIYVLGTLVVGPFSIVSMVVLTRLLAPSAYGELAVLFVVAGLLTTLYNVGTLHGTFMWVYGSSDGEEGDEGDADSAITSAPRRAMATGVAMTLVVIAIGTGVLCLLAPMIAHAFFQSVHAKPSAVRWASASAGAGSLWRLTVNVFRMERRAISFGVFNALRPLFVVGGTVPLVAAGFGVNGALAGTALGSLAAATVCVAVAHRSYALAFAWSDAREIARRGVVVVVPVLCLYTIHNGDILILSHFTSAHELGIYRVASRLAVIPSYFASAFLMAWSPLERGLLFTAAYRHNGQERTRATMLNYYLVAGLTIVLALDVAANGLVLLAGPSYRVAAPLIPLLSLSFVGYGAFIVLVRIFRLPQRHLLWYSLSALLAATLDIGASIVTIPLLGAYGTAVAELIGLGAGCLLWLVVVSRVEKVTPPLDFRRLAGVGAILAILATIQLVGARLWPAGRAEVLALMVVAFVTLLLALRVVPREHLRPLLRLAKHAAGGRIGMHDPTHRLAGLEPDRRALLASLLRDRTPLAIAAERLGRSERELRRELVATLRELSHSGAPHDELDAEVGSYLLSAEPEAQRDQVARRLVEQGIDPIELLQLDEALQRLRGAPAQTWMSDGTPARDDLTPRAVLEELARHVRELELSTRLAAIAILRDGRTAADVAAELRLPESVVAARVVRLLRRIGRLGNGGPEDVAVGIALFAKRSSSRDTVRARAVGHVYDQLRQAPPRRWRRVGLGERQVPGRLPVVALPVSDLTSAVDPAPTPTSDRDAAPSVGVLERV